MCQFLPQTPSLCYLPSFFSSGFLSPGLGGVGTLPDNASRIRCRMASRLAMPMSPNGETKLMKAKALSALVCSPNFTCWGGVLGLRGLSAELSYVYSMESVVPAGNFSGVLYKYWSCQLKSQSLIQIRGCFLPSGSVALTFISLQT